MKKVKHFKKDKKNKNWLVKYIFNKTGKIHEATVSAPTKEDAITVSKGKKEGNIKIISCVLTSNNQEKMLRKEARRKRKKSRKVNFYD